METREIRAPCFPPGLFFMRLYGYVPEFRIFSANAVLQVIVDKPRSLQVGVTNRSPEEFESSFFHVLAHGVGFGRRCRNLAQRPEGVDNRFSVGEERQGVFVKTAELLLYGEQQPCIGDRRFDFQTVSHNAVESHQPFDVFIGHLRHPLGIEIAKGFAIPLALPENSYPAQSGLGALQHEKLEQRLVVGHQFSPLPIMVFHIQLVGSAPAAASVYDVLHNHNV